MNISQNYHAPLLSLTGLNKKNRVLLTFCLLISFYSFASIKVGSNYVSPLTNNGYGKSYIFVENGVEFSVFPDGQFDFNILNNNSSLNISYGSPNVNISFNAGYNYNSSVQYDEFGAIIQIEHTPVYYDNYGRVIQAGNINIFYNNFGYVSRIGGLNVFYNRYNTFTHCTGYINIYNRSYVYRPWHRYYCAPTYRYRVVYNRPYRRYYYPVRYNYCRPFYNNYRPRTAVGVRRGHTIYRNSVYATANRNTRNRTTISNNHSSRRSYANNKSRLRNNTTINRKNLNNNNRRNYTNSNKQVKYNRKQYASRLDKTIVKRENYNNSTRRIHEKNSSPSARAKHVSQQNRIISKTRLDKKPKHSNSRTYNKKQNSKISTPSKRIIKTSEHNTRRVASHNRNSSNNNIKSSLRRRS
ncbi:hypothetical protein [Cognatitamlana onchidii]|uniref:hypothetical protein n=1 Tax=Cognatitamlana onchidii TaxID=2562860 RepID=UPI0010A6603F|nr:hypothetical protein [Algibacter onchidii]